MLNTWIYIRKDTIHIHKKDKSLIQSFALFTNRDESIILDVSIGKILGCITKTNGQQGKKIF